jgi:hypothetical protein
VERQEFCLGEIDWFPVDQFDTMDGSRIHKVDSPHRATDGIHLEIDDHGQGIKEIQDPPHPVYLLQS